MPLPPLPLSTARRCGLVVLAVALAGPVCVRAQPRETFLEDDEDAVVNLSPFVVAAADSESGYIAKETVAGNRLRANVKDVGASIDVLTADLLDDLGAWNVNDALEAVANVTTYQGNIDGNDPDNNAQWFGTYYYSRGFVSNTQLVDFFPRLMMPIDRFSTESLTFSRGPNAILVGIGSPGGSVGATSKRPRFDRHRTSVTFGTDSFGTLRGEFDSNVPLIKGKAAIRVAGVSQERHNYKDPSLDAVDALYGSLSLRPFPSTTVTANFEKGNRRRFLDINNIIYDAYTPWAEAGRPTVNFLTGAGQNSAGKGNFSSSAGSGLSVYTSSPSLVYVEGADGMVQDWRRMARSASWANSAVFPADSNVISRTSFNEDNNVLQLADGSRWHLDLDKNLFGPQAYHRTDYESASVFVEQKVTSDLSVELAANQHDAWYDFNDQGWGGGSIRTIYVDPNELLPDGSPNPHVGQPYLEDQVLEDTRELHETRDYRATAVYDLDLDDRKIFRSFGFGRHRLMALYENRRDDGYFAVGRTVNTTPLAGFNSQINNTQNALRRRYYLTPEAPVYESDGYLDGVNVGPGINIDTVMAQQPPRRSVDKTESYVAAAQSNFLYSKDGYHRLTTLYGFRRDRLDQQAMSFERAANGGFVGDYRDWASAVQSGTWNPAAKTTADSETYSVVFRPHQRIGLSYNYSDIFTAGATNFNDVFGNLTRPTYGETEDYGIKIDLWNGQIFGSLTYFETSQVDAQFSAPFDLRDYANRIWETIPNGASRVLPAQFRTYRDDATQGFELSLIGDLGKSFRARLTAGQSRTEVSKYADEVVGYIAQNRAEWRQFADLPLSSPIGSVGTVGQAIDAYEQAVADTRAIVGKKSANSREYNLNFNANYSFTEGFVKGASLGGNIRWVSKSIIGYARRDDGNLEVDQPYYGPDTFTLSLNTGYGRRIMGGKVDWDLRLYVFNVLDSDDIQPRRAVDSGVNHAPLILERYTQAPRSLQVRTTFSF